MDAVMSAGTVYAVPVLATARHTNADACMTGEAWVLAPHTAPCSGSSTVHAVHTFTEYSVAGHAGYTVDSGGTSTVYAVSRRREWHRNSMNSPATFAETFAAQTDSGI
jgi:hypothetical protein